MTAHRAIRPTVLVVALGVVSCAHQEAVSPRPDAARGAPQDVPGLEVTGPRTRANVMANVAPMAQMMQEIYAKHRVRKPELEGRLVVRFPVEWNGEIGAIEILPGSTVTDPDFRREVLRPIEFMDFDAWGRDDEDTVVVLPVVFGD